MTGVRRTAIAMMLVPVVLAGCGGEDAATVEGLRESEWVTLLEDPLPEVRRAAVRAQPQLTRDVGVLLGRLEPRLNDPEPTVAVEAAHALAPLGAPAAVPLVRAIVRARALSRSDLVAEASGLGSDAVPALVQSAREEPGTAPAVLAVLRIMGPAGHPAAGFLKEAVGLDNPGVRRDAWHALGAIGPRADVPANAVLEATGDLDVAVRQAAMWAAPRLGLGNEPLLEVLRAGLADPEEAVQREALAGAAQMGSGAAPLVPGIRSALDAFELATKEAALEAAGSVGVPDAALVERVVALRTHPEPAISEAAGLAAIRLEEAGAMRSEQ